MKVKNFAADAVKVNITMKDQDQGAGGTRDLFSRLLYLAVIEDLDIYLLVTR